MCIWCTGYWPTYIGGQLAAHVELAHIAALVPAGLPLPPLPLPLLHFLLHLGQGEGGGEELPGVEAEQEEE